MQVDVKFFMENHVICQRTKGSCSNASLYQSLPIPNRPWESLSMEFVLGFPKTHKAYDNVFVVVERFIKMAHFIPCNYTNDASHIAKLFFKEIVRIHGLLLTIVSDKD